MIYYLVYLAVVRFRNIYGMVVAGNNRVRGEDWPALVFFFFLALQTI